VPKGSPKKTFEVVGMVYFTGWIIFLMLRQHCQSTGCNTYKYTAIHTNTITELYTPHCTAAHSPTFHVQTVSETRALPNVVQ